VLFEHLQFIFFLNFSHLLGPNTLAVQDFAAIIVHFCFWKAIKGFNSCIKY
jgi:hypothetical protein